jgi:hypothetical protein
VSANEIGNPAFNGDIAINGPRGGYLIGFEDLLDPAYADVARGYRNYIRVLAALKEIRDGLTVNNLTPIISAGLNTPGDAPEGTKLNLMEDEVSLKGVLFLHANGLDDYVDQYGVHSYILWAGNSASNIHYLNSALIMDSYTKPVAVTEWGMKVAAGCPANDAPRQTQFNLCGLKWQAMGKRWRAFSPSTGMAPPMGSICVERSPGVARSP